MSRVMNHVCFEQAQFSRQFALGKKNYGEYLLNSGKWKQNRRERKMRH